MQLLEAVLLGILEGLTEFLPISSTGHLILAIEFIGFEGPPGKVFEVVIQLGAILAICWYYRGKLLDVLGHLGDSRRQRFVLLIALGFLPAAIVGATAHGFIKSALFSPYVVAVMLIVGGVGIWLIERLRPTPRFAEVDDIGLGRALLLGCFQALSVIPGTSRSGATIMGGLLLRLERRAAAEFSFLLAIPTMLAATVYDIYKNQQFMSLDNVGLIAAGFVSAFIAALLTVRWLLAFISRHSFVPFAIYRILLGSFMLWWLAGGFGQ